MGNQKGRGIVEGSMPQRLEVSKRVQMVTNMAIGLIQSKLEMAPDMTKLGASLLDRDWMGDETVHCLHPLYKTVQTWPVLSWTS